MTWQEEYKILDRMHRQKVAEVEKLGQTVRELEEALLSGAAAANAVRDYQRQVHELKVGMQFIIHKINSFMLLTSKELKVLLPGKQNELNLRMSCCFFYFQGEKKTLERTLSRAMVAENRAALVMANEWKDANDKVIPVKQWLEERRVLMVLSKS